MSHFTKHDTCNGKIRYEHKRDAVTMANLRTQGRQRQRRHRPESLRVYHCPQCNGWHLTHKHTH